MNAAAWSELVCMSPQQPKQSTRHRIPSTFAARLRTKFTLRCKVKVYMVGSAYADRQARACYCVCLVTQDHFGLGQQNQPGRRKKYNLLYHRYGRHLFSTTKMQT